MGSVSGEGGRLLIFLVGMMGAGKTEVGALAARRLGVPFLDTDRLVEEEAGRSIRDLWAKEGESGFRRREREALGRVLARGEAVVATGGGIVLDPDNVRRMREAGLVVWLEAPPATLAARIGETTGRPVLDGASDLPARLERVLTDREAAYAAAAHRRLDTDRLTPEQVAERLVAEWLEAAGT